MKVLKCKACGAYLEYKLGSPVSICSYCDIVNIISEDVLSPVSITQTENNEVVGATMQIEEKYMANYFIALGVSQGGRLLISKREILFRPHIINLGNLSDKYIKIQDITSFEKPFFPLFLKIHATGNRVMFLSTWSRNKIIQSILKRQ
jgi:hypothetical protein